jgi:hypothetical protein
VLTFVAHAAVIALLFLIGLIGTALGSEVVAAAFALALGALLLVGATQLLYVLPLFLVARRRGLTRLAQGLAIGAGVTILLNAACWGTVLLSGPTF